MPRNFSRLAARGRFPAGAAMTTVALLLTAVLAVGASAARASTLAYVNLDDFIVYVANGNGGDVHEVAAPGPGSPTLDASGNLYLLDANGTQVDEIQPGTAAQPKPIALTGADPTQLAASPDGRKLAVTDGEALDDITSAQIINRRTGRSRALPPGAMSPHWVSDSDLGLSILPTQTPSLFGPRAAVDNGLFTHPTFFAQLGVPAPAAGAVLEYAPNPQRTEAAAVIDIGISIHTAQALIVFPINSATLAPTSNPVALAANDQPGVCSVSDRFVYTGGDGANIAWSPDGSTLAFVGSSANGLSGGILETRVGAWNENCSQIGLTRLVIPNGYEPSWGPSNDRDFATP